MINFYQFGKIVIDGKEYDSDVIIYPNRVDSRWWRKEGHSLSLEDIKEVIKGKPDILIVGKGDPGLMEVPKKTEEEIKLKGIKLMVEKTEEACNLYNKLCKSNKVIAALHLTC